ncbi:MAG: recombination protein RecR [Candidatus Kapabacteria bacterium]|nr:recombination protein RecR [Candidatus Kapabacteria bacterium]
MFTSDSIEATVEMLSALPTIGRKTAQRLTFFLLRQPEDFTQRFVATLLDLKKNVKFCSTCFNFTETDPCPICSSSKRDSGVICVVEEPSDVLAIEKSHEYFGKYHVLHGVLNPLDGVGPEDIKLRELIARLDGSVHEIILALNPNVEGEVTTQYIAKFIAPLGIKVTRIARGVPIGSDLEFADEATISRALQGRGTV